MGTQVEQDSAPGLKIVFNANGEEKVVRIVKRPLGAEFTKRGRGPTRISHVSANSRASALGLEVGWVVQSVAEENMYGRSFEDTQNTIQRGLKPLPVELS